MERKTIRLDEEAYRRLKAAKRQGESFGDVIKRLIPRPADLPQPIDFEDWIRRMEADPFSDEFIAAVEQQIAAR